MSGSSGAFRVAADDRGVEYRAGAQIAHRQPLRILLADDCAASRVLHLGYLEQLGYPADAVANGEEVLRALAVRSFDVVLLDIDMPLMGGITAAGKIREQRNAGSLFLVAVTAGKNGLNRDRIESAGFDAYIAKPATAGKFLAVLDKAWARLLAAPASRSPADTINNAPGGALPVDESLAALVLRRVVPVYLRELPTRIDALRAARAARNVDEMARLCHALKGAGRILGAAALSAACEKIEGRAYDGELPEAALLDELIALAVAAGNSLERRLASEAPDVKL